MSLAIYNKLERAPVRDEKYKAWIRSFPCIVCLSMRNVEACHTPGERGLGQKADDKRTVPMCRIHHQEQTLIGWTKFTTKYELDLEVWIALLSSKPHVGPIEKDSWGASWPEGGLFVVGSLAILPGARREWLIENVFEQVRKQNSARLLSARATPGHEQDETKPGKWRVPSESEL